MAWRKVHIGQFLTPREDRYKPDDPAISDMPRIEKIDFTGKIVISDKPSKTNMIIIQPGDFVISGINVAKGAMAVYQGDVSVKATIHYSSYKVDHGIINLEYFKRFLKSPVFIRILKEQVSGGIKTEIKPKHLLPLTIDLPDIAEQESILSRFLNTETDHSELRAEIDRQKKLFSQLRQAILQEAIQGKLTEDWRKENPDVEPAGELLKRIAAEKAELVKAKKIRKQKSLPPISDDEIPFDIPETWEWCRLGDAALFERGKSRHRPRNAPHLYEGGIYPFVQTGEVAQSKHCGYVITSYSKCYNETGLAQSRLWPKGTLCITIAANIAETGFLGIEACIPDSVVGVTSLSSPETLHFIRYFIEWTKDKIIRLAPATAQKNINLGIISEMLFPLPRLQSNRKSSIVSKLNSPSATSWKQR